jgi:hypothetical protein
MSGKAADLLIDVSRSLQERTRAVIPGAECANGPTTLCTVS